MDSKTKNKINQKFNKEIKKLRKKDLKYNIRLEKVNAQIKDINKLIEESGGNFEEVINKIEELNKKKERLIEAQATNKLKLKRLYSESDVKPSKYIKPGLKKAVTAPVQIAKGIVLNTVTNTAKGAVKKINPLDRKVDFSSTSDSGIESLRLAYSTAKKADRTIKTVRKSVKITKNTIKGTAKTAKAAVKTTYKIAKSTVNVTAKSIKIISSATIHIAAAAMNPIFLIIICLVLVILLCISATVLMFGGAAVANNTTQYEMSNPVGLDNIPDEWKNGLIMLQTSKNNKKNDFENIINNLYYSEDDLTNSDLVYMERIDSAGSKTIYSKSFVIDSRKDELKNAFDWNLSLNDLEILSIAYVYLEKIENENGKTDNAIYKVSFTQEIFDEIVNKLVMFSDNTYNNQECPGKICTKHIETSPNPEYQSAKDLTEKYHNAYLDWCDIANYMFENSKIKDGNAQSQHWNNNIKWRIDNWNNTYNHATPYNDNNGWDFVNLLYRFYSDQWDYMDSLPPNIETITYSCDHKHKLYSLGLYFYNKYDIMNILEFSDNEKSWEALTESGFETAISS